MPNVLIVHAHPEPKSFSSALARLAADVLRSRGHQVEVSDLYAMRFDPVSSRQNFTTVSDPDYFKPQKEEHHATLHTGFAPALESEIRKLEQADLLLFSFPLWWFGMPAILKGWVDRVFAFSRIYGNGRWYENGIGRGKRALVLMTTGSPATAFHRNGLHASLESILTPIHHGVFWFNGFTPLSPFITWGAAHVSEEQRGQELARLKNRLSGVFQEQGSLLPLADDHESGSWIDRLSRFLVSFRSRTTESALDVDDVAGLRELRNTGRLLRALLPPGAGHPWLSALEFRARTRDEVVEWIRELPLSRRCEWEVAPLDPLLEDALSPVWLDAAPSGPSGR